MKSHHCLALIFISLLLGCHRVPKLFTFSQISIKDKLVADVHVQGLHLEAKKRITKTILHGDHSSPTIAVLDVDGLLLNENFTGPLSEGENPVNFFVEKLRIIEQDPCVCGVVLRINSPGGGVTASDIMRQELLAFKQRTQLPVVACVMDLGTGGGYYLACASDCIVAHPTSVVGGVGVIVNLFNLSDVMGSGNVFAQPVRAGQKIDMGSLLREIDPDSKKLLQKMADEFHDRFEQVVVNSRKGLNPNDESNFDGRVFTASEAMSRGFIDEIGYIDTALSRVAERSMVNRGYGIAMYHRPTDTPHSLYSVTPNTPLQSSYLPISVPGLDRSRLPRFLYLWQTDPSLEGISGH